MRARATANHLAGEQNVQSERYCSYQVQAGDETGATCRHQQRAWNCAQSLERYGTEMVEGNVEAICSCDGIRDASGVQALRLQIASHHRGGAIVSETAASMIVLVGTQ